MTHALHACRYAILGNLRCMRSGGNMLVIWALVRLAMSTGRHARAARLDMLGVGGRDVLPRGRQAGGAGHAAADGREVQRERGSFREAERAAGRAAAARPEGGLAVGQAAQAALLAERDHVRNRLLAVRLARARARARALLRGSIKLSCCAPLDTL